MRGRDEVLVEEQVVYRDGLLLFNIDLIFLRLISFGLILRLILSAVKRLCFYNSTMFTWFEGIRILFMIPIKFVSLFIWVPKFG